MGKKSRTREEAKKIAEEVGKVPSTADEIRTVCAELEELLLRKNAAYGDSALSPVRVFSKADNVEQIKVRLDDKISRLSRGHALSDESLDDTINDLMGYMVLLKIANKRRQAVPAERL